MRPRIKICGINAVAAFDAAVEGGADYLGFNFFPPSPRYVTPEIAAALSARAKGGPLRVGLFVDPAEALVEAVLAALPLDLLQIYGPPALAIELGRHFARPVWLPVAVESAADLPNDAADADALLLEARAPADATRPGGNARSFDWSVLAGWTPPAPWILAGGLTPENVAEAVALTGAPVVDVSSGVESTRGVKDPARIAAFIAAARGG